MSKAFQLIGRFSEDVDLTVPLSTLDLSAPQDIASGKAVERLIGAASERCAALLAGEVRRELSSRMADVLGPDAWTLDVDESDSLTLHFGYPASLDSAEYAGGYVRPAVRFEFGVRGGTEPTIIREIEPYCTQLVPGAYGRHTTPVRVLAAERTLWEKATICHAEYHRPPRESAPRMSRHYSDLATLAVSAVADAATSQLDLLAAVVENKRRYFRSGWANYELATPAGLRIVPHEVLERILRRDYGEMAVMFFGVPEPFDEVLRKLVDFERRVRSLS